MSIENRQELENTRAKVRLMEEALSRTRSEACDNEKVREWTIRSLAKRINQFKEEMIRFEIRVREAAKTA